MAPAAYFERPAIDRAAHGEAMSRYRQVIRRINRALDRCVGAGDPLQAAGMHSVGMGAGRTVGGDRSRRWTSPARAGTVHKARAPKPRYGGRTSSMLTPTAGLTTEGHHVTARIAG